MSTDLFGKPLQKAPKFELTLWQKKQATLLYYWTSLDYLKNLKGMVEALIKGADVHLELAKLQGRDDLLTNDRWGVRDTPANWSTYVYPALEDFKLQIVKALAQRTVENFEGTGANSCAHMIEDHSSLWMTEQEEAAFMKQHEAIQSYAHSYDNVIKDYFDSRAYNGKTLALRWSDSYQLFKRIPKFQVRTDVEAISDTSLPPRTGVYVSQDDPNACLQFGWTGSKYGKLRPASTLNNLGLRALAAIGANALWYDEAKTGKFAKEAHLRKELTDFGGFDEDAIDTPSYAIAILGRNTFTTRPCKWYYVEVVNDEFEDLAELEAAETKAETQRIRVQGGQKCPKTGYYFTPAQTNSRRHFKQGDTMPSLGGDYGVTIWQWDEQQT
jgi:hypothetical protein